MKVNDSLYGEISFPRWIEPLVWTSVIQRLRWIALSNVPSLSYPMISGVSRYAHSLGVFHLASVIGKHLLLPEEQQRVLQCAALLHDAGMPPLGHLMEESLAMVGVSYDHEESLRIILLDEGRRFKLMPDGQPIGVIQAIEKGKVDSNEIFSAIVGQGMLGKYIASNIDVDNIDNVIRLYRLIFSNKKGYSPEEIAKACLPSCQEGSTEFSLWSSIRMQLYTKLMFSLEDFAQKATYKRLISSYMHELLSEKGEAVAVDNIRFLNDSQMMARILYSLGDEEQSAILSGRYDRLISYGWVNRVSKKQLITIREALPSEFEGLYFDFIPDKRSKNVGQERGALVGIFDPQLTSDRRKSGVVPYLYDQLDDYRESFTPADEEAGQLTLL
ncbi:MAG: HD domain-containing protein [Candidatus Thiodiazotropha endolucinida]